MKTNRRLFNLVHGDPRFELKSATKTAAASMYLYDEISPFGVTAADFVSEISMLGGQDFNLYVNSPGGDVFEGLAMLNTLRAYPGKVTGYVDAIAASAASFILMGCDEVVMRRNSELMIHDAWGMCIGNAEDMVDMAGRLDKVSDNIADVYGAKAGGSVADWRGRMKAEAWLSADEAVELGLADRVDGAGQDVSNALAFDLTRFKNRKPEPVRGPVTHTGPEAVDLTGIDIAALLSAAFQKETA